MEAAASAERGAYSGRAADGGGHLEEEEEDPDETFSDPDVADEAAAAPSIVEIVPIVVELAPPTTTLAPSTTPSRKALSARGTARGAALAIKPVPGSARGARPSPPGSAHPGRPSPPGTRLASPPGSAHPDRLAVTQLTQLPTAQILQMAAARAPALVDYAVQVGHLDQETVRTAREFQPRSAVEILGDPSFAADQAEARATLAVAVSQHEMQIKALAQAE